MASRNHRDIFASEIEWRQGVSAGITYAQYAMDAQDARAPRITLSCFAPGERVSAHTHASNYFEYVIEGEQVVGKTRFGPGDMRIVKGGTGYGPITIGPQGCKVLIVFQDGSRTMMETLPRKKAVAAE